MRKTLLVFFFSVALVIEGKAQSESYKTTLDHFEALAQNFKLLIASKTNSEKYRDRLDKFLEDIDLYLDGGYGFSFDEMNKLRVIKKYCKAFSEFVYMAGAGRGGGYASGKDIRLVQEIFPDIQVYIVNNYADGLTVHKVIIGKYQVFVCRNAEKETTKKVYYACRTANGNVSGSFGLGYKCYRKMFDNSDNLNNQDLKPVLTKVEIISRGETFMTCPEE